jgi:hypothetical protein
VNQIKRMPRWPLFLIAAPASIAIWSGWVGLGQLCGFGIIHPLPGIWDAARLNTAITLPVGVEAYAAYALGAWLTPGTSERARRFAKFSAVGALGLGMAGQVIYHLLAAAHAARAPWPVVMLVSCLPVIALALGTALAHLLREPAEVAAEEVPGAVTIPTTDNTAETVTHTVPGDVDAGVPVVEPVSTVPSVPVNGDRTVAAGCARGRAPVSKSRMPERIFTDEIGRGELPSLRAIKSRAHVGTDRARTILLELEAMCAGQELTADA